LAQAIWPKKHLSCFRLVAGRAAAMSVVYARRFLAHKRLTSGRNVAACTLAAPAEFMTGQHTRRLHDALQLSALERRSDYFSGMLRLRGLDGQEDVQRLVDNLESLTSKQRKFMASASLISLTHDRSKDPKVRASMAACQDLLRTRLESLCGACRTLCEELHEEMADAESLAEPCYYADSTRLV